MLNTIIPSSRTRTKSSDKSIPTKASGGSAIKNYPWLETEQCLGNQLRTVKNRQCWEAIGAAREMFQQLGPAIKSYLELNSEPLATWVTWSIYMIGRTRGSAVPTIVFCSPDPAHRRAVRKLIKHSPVLEPYPGVSTYDMHRAPDFDQLVALANCEDPTLSSAPECDTQAVPKPSAGPILSIKAWPVPELRVEVQACDSAEGWKTVRSTVGGAIDWGTGPYYMTTMHGFLWDPAILTTDNDNDIADDDDDDNAEFDDNDDDDSVADATFSNEDLERNESSWDQVEVDQPTRPILSDLVCPDLERPLVPLVAQDTNYTSTYNNQIEFYDSAEDLYANSNETLASSGDIEVIRRCSLVSETGNRVEANLVLCSNSRQYAGLDYALIKVSEVVANHLCVENKPPLDEVKVAGPEYFSVDYRDICLGSPQDSSKHGRLHGTATYTSLLFQSCFQTSYKISMGSPLQQGDSGIWVYDRQTGVVVGHLVAGSCTQSVGYIVPAYQILDDILLRRKTELASIDSLPCPKELEFQKQSHARMHESLYETVHELWKAPNDSGNRAHTDLDAIDALRVNYVAELRQLESARAESEDTSERVEGSVPSPRAAKSQHAAELTKKFRQLLSTKRMNQLCQEGRLAHQENNGVGREDAPPSYAATIKAQFPTNSILRRTPMFPQPPMDSRSIRFRNMLNTLSGLPKTWENPGLLDEALSKVPLDRIYAEAEEESQIFSAEAESLTEQGTKMRLAAWDYQDCVIRALMRWFHSRYFCWVNNPPCSSCGWPTIGLGVTAPIPDEQVRGAKQVELYQCSKQTCRGYERFPRYSDAFVLMETRRGRVGEWANCFGMLCRAMGARTRWVWNSEDHVWVEIYSAHRRRWVHVDVCEQAWDTPWMYTSSWQRKLGYCIAFSTEGVADVTSRYVRASHWQAKRERAPEAVLLHIIQEMNDTMRASFDKRRRWRLQLEDQREREQMLQQVVSGLVDKLCGTVTPQSARTSTTLTNTETDEKLTSERKGEVNKRAKASQRYSRTFVEQDPEP